MDLDSYFCKHFRKPASVNHSIDGMTVGKNRAICERHGRPVWTPDDRLDTPKGYLPDGWEAINSPLPRSFGQHLVSSATAEELRMLFDQIKELQNQAENMLFREPKPPPPKPAKRLVLGIQAEEGTT